MRITTVQQWKRNMPTTTGGESLTVSITYSSMDKATIDRLESLMPKGIITGKISDQQLEDYFCRLEKQD